jgi:hypothetical protein
MSEKLSAAVETLQEELQRQLIEVAETKRMINGLLRRMGKEPAYAEEMESVRSATIRSDQFYGKQFSTAAREYLEMRRDKGAVDASDILVGMKSGGFDFASTGWKPKDYLRMLSISLAKNTATFHRLPNGTFGLLAWYPEVANRKRTVTSSDESSSEESSSEEGSS